MASYAVASVRSWTANGDPALTGTFQMHLENVPLTGTAVIQASTNLTAWSPLFTNLTPTNQVFYTDPKASNYLQRFYRAIWTP